MHAHRVMAGLVPAIHDLLCYLKENVDARHKAGHDGERVFAPALSQPSGSGMNSVSFGTDAKRPLFQSSLACSMRSLREETKFHQM